MAASYGTVTVASSATQILAANNNRKGSLISNTSAGTVFLGFDASVTTVNGMPLLQNSTLANSGPDESWKGAIWGIVASATSDCRFWEWEP